MSMGEVEDMVGWKEETRNEFASGFVGRKSRFGVN
jgi:hypothetical protein